MKVSFFDNFEKIRQNDVSVLEKSLGFDLPESYKNYLIKFNGGRVKPNKFKSNDSQIESDIQFFFGITKNENYDIEKKYRYFLDIISNETMLLPIAIDSGGNLILLSCSKDKFESIYFWGHDIADSERNTFLITTSFKKFTSDLFEYSSDLTDLDIAIFKQDIDYFNVRISRGEKVDDIKNKYGQTAVQLASINNKLKLLCFFFTNKSKMDGTIKFAVQNGHIEALKYLLNIGINSDEKDLTQMNQTPLIQASSFGFFEISKELIRTGADINAKDTTGKSVLRYAIISGNDELISYLESLGAIDTY